MSASSFRSPFAALVWKEWRESWWLLILVVVAPAALYLAGVALCFSDYTRNALPVFVIGLPAFTLWGLVLFLGAGLFAGERARGTSAFQFERPTSRGTIWNAKLLMPAVALVIGELVFLVASDWLYQPLSWRHQAHIAPFMFLVIGVLCFASVILCSVLLPRPITAWAAGGVLCFVLFLGQGLLFAYFRDPEMSHGDINLPWVLLLSLLTLEAIGLLWLSRVLYFRRSDD